MSKLELKTNLKIYQECLLLHVKQLFSILDFQYVFSYKETSTFFLSSSDKNQLSERVQIYPNSQFFLYKVAE